MKFPTCSEVADAILEHSRNIADCEIRLQVYPSGSKPSYMFPDGSWALRVGDPSYDLNHSGYWGASWLPEIPRFATPLQVCQIVIGIAGDLLDQAIEQAAECGEETD
jgi:hypothetical protein